MPVSVHARHPARGPVAAHREHVPPPPAPAPFGLLHPRDRAALKTASRVLVEHLGGVDAAASATRVVASKIAEYYSPNHPLRFAPIDVIADLEAVAGKPIVTAHLARLAAHGLVPIPATQAGPLAEHVAQAITETTRIATCLIAAQADGRITPAERDDLRALALESIRLWHQVVADCSAGDGG